jgi:uncharacterized membrane protein YgdD (TMEM256/DUF423 family)
MMFRRSVIVFGGTTSVHAKTTLMVACVAGGLAVMVGAFGAHALPGWLSRHGLDNAVAARRLETLETGVRYQMYHALALLGLGLWYRQAGANAATVPAVLWLLGIVLFSGCLYGYALTGSRLLAMVVPLGGISFIAGWLSLAWSFSRG